MFVLACPEKVQAPSFEDQMGPSWIMFWPFGGQLDVAFGLLLWLWWLLLQLLLLFGVCVCALY